MAVFDLKRALVYLVDGYSHTGAVNNVSGYAIGATTMTITTTGVIPKGASFSIPEGGLNYIVKSTVETLGATTSITFSPPLVNAVSNSDVINFGGRSLKLKIGDGLISYDEKRPREYKKDRGLLDTIRDGDQEPIDVKLDIRWEFLRSDANDPSTDMFPTPEEVLKGVGNASNWVTSAADPCEPYAVDIYIVYDPQCPNVKDEGILLQDYRYESIMHDFKQGQLSTTGKCNHTDAVVSRFLP